MELWWLAMIALLITSLISAVFPAAGAGGRFGDLAAQYAPYLPHFFGLRDGSLQNVALSQMQGIITFPSYHTVLAVLLPYAYRRERYALALVATLNILMLFSIPPYGNHYIADMLAGACVAGTTVVLVRIAVPKASG